MTPKPIEERLSNLERRLEMRDQVATMLSEFKEEYGAIPSAYDKSEIAAIDNFQAVLEPLLKKYCSRQQKQRTITTDYLSEVMQEALETVRNHLKNCHPNMLPTYSRLAMDLCDSIYELEEVT